MSKFLNTLRLKTERILGASALPINEGRTYYDIDTNVFYRDINNQRYALGEVHEVENYKNVSGQKKLRNVVLINKKLNDENVWEYQLLYIAESGVVQELTSGSGASAFYTAGLDIEISAGNEISVGANILRSETDNWIVQNKTDKFKIIQKLSGTNKDVLTIHETEVDEGPDSVNANAQVKIDAKTTISELDFGVW